MNTMIIVAIISLFTSCHTLFPMMVLHGKWQKKQERFLLQPRQGVKKQVNESVVEFVNNFDEKSLNTVANDFSALVKTCAVVSSSEGIKLLKHLNDQQKLLLAVSALPQELKETIVALLFNGNRRIAADCCKEPLYEMVVRCNEVCSLKEKFSMAIVGKNITLPIAEDHLYFMTPEQVSYLYSLLKSKQLSSSELDRRMAREVLLAIKYVEEYKNCQHKLFDSIELMGHILKLPFSFTTNLCSEDLKAEKKLLDNFDGIVDCCARWQLSSASDLKKLGVELFQKNLWGEFLLCAEQYKTNLRPFKFDELKEGVVVYPNFTERFNNLVNTFGWNNWVPGSPHKWGAQHLAAMLTVQFMGRAFFGSHKAAIANGAIITHGLSSLYTTIEVFCLDYSYRKSATRNITDLNKFIAS